MPSLLVRTVPTPGTFAAWIVAAPVAPAGAELAPPPPYRPPAPADELLLLAQAARPRARAAIVKMVRIRNTVPLLPACRSFYGWPPGTVRRHELRLSAMVT